MNAIGSALFPTDGYAIAERTAFRPLAGTPETAKDSVAPTAETASTSGTASSDGRPAGGAATPGTPSASGSPSRASGAKSAAALSASDQAVVAELRRVDLQVRNHEMAHMSAGAGVVTGGPSYTYQRGPDGGQYAVGGEVPISLSADPRDPSVTLRKAEQVQRAALAPAEPSSQDRAVAAAAASLAAEARTQIAQERTQALQDGAGTSSSGKTSSGPAQAPGQSLGETSGGPDQAPGQSPGTSGAAEGGNSTGPTQALGPPPGTSGAAERANSTGAARAPGHSPGTTAPTQEAAPGARDRRKPVDVRV